MNRNSGNVSKTKKLIPGVSNNSKLNRKSFQKLSDSSSISSNRNSSAHSEEDLRVGAAYLKAQMNNNVSYEEQEQIMKKLQGQVKDLRHKLRILEESVDSKDYSLGTISREKDRAIGEIRRLERSNKQLRQQLNDERNHYLEEKEKFCEEMTKYKKKLQVKITEEKKSVPISKQSLINQSLKWQLNKEKGDCADLKTYLDLKQSKSQRLLGTKDKKLINQSTMSFSDCQFHRRNSIESLHLYEGDDVSLQMAALQTENAKLRSIICERDERNYELCLRFLRLKHYKNDIRSRFQDLENEYLQVIANLMDKIDEARQEFNFIIDQKFKRPLHSTNAMYLQMVQKNSRMAFENASLRLENQCLKKELNKYMNSSVEFNDRKNDLTLATADELDSKSTPRDPKSSGKTKRIKKNVNFHEIQTIYERDLNFKHSDTDSNYMSKTSTTVFSNGSLRDPKSNESIIEGEEINQNRIQPNFPNSLPDEILHKIFKRVDTSSCQTMDSGRSKADANFKIKGPGGDEPDGNEAGSHAKNDRNPETITPDIPCKEVQKIPIIVERKSFGQISDSSLPCESKESVRIEMKETSEFSQVPLIRMNMNEKENFSTPRKQEKHKSWTFKNRLKSQVRGKWSFDRDFEDRSGSLDFPMLTFAFDRRSRLGQKEKIPQAKPEREASQTRNMLRTRQYVDSCGLQEKLEFSDLELTCSATVANRMQATGELENTTGDKTKTVSTRIEMIESVIEDMGVKTLEAMESLTPAIGSRSRSSNKLNLHEELIEAARDQLKSAKPWRKDLKQQSIQSKTTVFITDKENDKNLQFDKKESIITQDCTKSMRAPNLAQNKKPEGSKRFSHRLISTSPEQLRNLLRESQLGTIRMAPIVVGNAMIENSPSLNYEEENNEIFLQLVLPQKCSEQTSRIYSNDEPIETPKVEKETSMSGISPVSPIKSTNQIEICSSDIRIPMSSLPMSNSTMEIMNSATLDRSNIIMRTLSAPGLLESSWLDPYCICEMRDCVYSLLLLNLNNPFIFNNLSDALHDLSLEAEVKDSAFLYHRLSFFPSQNGMTLHTAAITAPVIKTVKMSSP